MNIQAANICMNTLASNICLDIWGASNICMNIDGAHNICMNMFGASNICMNIYGASNTCMNIHGASNVCVNIYRASSIWMNSDRDLACAWIFVKLYYRITLRNRITQTAFYSRQSDLQNTHISSCQQCQKLSIGASDSFRHTASFQL